MIPGKPLTATARGDSSSYSTASATFSAASASVWSDTASQSSSSSACSSDFESSDSYFVARGLSESAISRIGYAPVPHKPRPAQHQQQHQPQLQQHQHQHQQNTAIVVPAELRQNPRRTGPGRVASLVRQSDRRVNFVDSLVDSSTQIVETIWPYGSRNGLSLRTFIQETLRRSRTSYSTLQVALYYLILIKPHVPKYAGLSPDQLQGLLADNAALLDGRRMFLSALILASKYLQDRNYSSRAWSKITGLTTQEINHNEISFLISINWKLHITNEVFRRWTEIVLKHTPPPSSPPPGSGPVVVAQQCSDWKRIILELRPDLSNAEALIPTSAAVAAAAAVATPMVLTPAPTPASSPSPQTPNDLCVSSPRSILNHPLQQSEVAGPAVVPPTPPPYDAKFSGRLAPTLSVFPTPGLTPQSQTVKASSASFLEGQPQPPATSFFGPSVDLDRISDLPAHCRAQRAPRRRPRLCNVFSSNAPLPSPESIVSDSSSRSSRSSSISSASSLASSLASAPFNPTSMAMSSGTRLPLARYSPGRGITSSPEQYTSKAACLSSSSKRREPTLEDMVRYSESDAAQALQELHDYPRCSGALGSTPTPTHNGLKRERERGFLTDEARELSMGEMPRNPAAVSWCQSSLRQSLRLDSGMPVYAPVPVYAQSARKRLCLSEEGYGAP